MGRYQQADVDTPTKRVCPNCKGSGENCWTRCPDGDGEAVVDLVECGTCLGDGDVTMSSELAKLFDAQGFDDRDVWACESCCVHVLRHEAINNSWHNDEDGTRCSGCEAARVLARS